MLPSLTKSRCAGLGNCAWAPQLVTVTVRSPYGQITIAVALTDDLVRGTVAVPHGWGHKGTGRWHLANRAGGANVNQLTSSAPEDLEALAGMSWLTGVPVEVDALRN